MSSSIHQYTINYAIMQHLRVLDANILNKYDMIHKDDHYLLLNGFQFIKVRIIYLLKPINYLTQTVAILSSLTF